MATVLTTQNFDRLARQVLSLKKTNEHLRRDWGQLLLQRDALAERIGRMEAQAGATGDLRLRLERLAARNAALVEELHNVMYEREKYKCELMELVARLSEVETKVGQGNFE